MLSLAAAGAVAWLSWSALQGPPEALAPLASAGTAAQADGAAADGAPTPAPRSRESVDPLRPAARVAPNSATPTRVKSALAVEFERSKDLRALYDKFSPMASAEAKYYAARALQECLEEQRTARAQNLRTDFDARVAPGDPNYEQRVAAFLKISEDRCSGFAPEMLTRANYAAAVGEAVAAGSTAARVAQLQLDLQRRMSASNGGERRVAMTGDELIGLRDAVKSLDAETLRSVANLWLLWVRPEGVRVGPAQEPANSESWTGAWSLLACENGADCGPDNARVTLDCALRGYCGSPSYEAYLQQYAMSPAQYQEALRYRDIIRTAIAQQQWDWMGLGAAPTLGWIRPATRITKIKQVSFETD